MKCFAVTNLSDNPEFISGIPVREIENLERYKETALIIISVGLKASLEVQNILEKRGFKNYIKTDDFMRPDIWQYYLEIDKWLVI